MNLDMVTYELVQDKFLQVNGQNVLLDYAVAELYGVETRDINKAVKNNPDKFPRGYVLELDKKGLDSIKAQIAASNRLIGNGVRDLQWKNSTAKMPSPKSRVIPKAFTERGLYMLATILKGKRAVQTTIAIIEAFAKLRELGRTIAEMSKDPDEYTRKTLMQKSGEIVDDLFGDALTTNETETEIELNFAVLKLRHTVKRSKP